MAGKFRKTFSGKIEGVDIIIRHGPAQTFFSGDIDELHIKGVDIMAYQHKIPDKVKEFPQNLMNRRRILIL